MHIRLPPFGRAGQCACLLVTCMLVNFQRQLNRKLGAFTLNAVYRHTAAVKLGKRLDDGQSYACASASRACPEELVESPLGVAL